MGNGQKCIRDFWVSILGAEAAAAAAAAAAALTAIWWVHIWA